MSQPDFRTLIYHREEVTTLAFTPDGTTLISGSWDYTTATWDVSTGSKTHDLLAHTGEVKALAVSSDGKQYASASQDKRIIETSIDPAQELGARAFIGHKKEVSAVQYSPNGKILASVSWNVIFLWDLVGRYEDGEEKRRIVAGEDDVVEISFSFDNKMLASISEKGELRLWDVAKRDLVHEFRSHVVAWSPDSRLLAVNGRKTTVELRDVGSGEQVHLLKAHRGPVGCVAFSPDGRRLATGSSDRTVWIWDVQSGEALFRLGPMNGGVYKLCFSPSSKLLVGMSWPESDVKVWDLETEKEVVGFEEDGDRVNAIGFGAGGMSGEDEVVLVAYAEDKDIVLAKMVIPANR